MCNNTAVGLGILILISTGTLGGHNLNFIRRIFPLVFDYFEENLVYFHMQSFQKEVVDYIWSWALKNVLHFILEDAV